jgi:uncharacterized protein (UPF0548 family)
MFRLRRPADAAVRDFLRRQSVLDFTYTDVGRTNAEPVSPPAGYTFNRVRLEIGRGRDAFDAAVAAFHRWDQFDVGWVNAFPTDTLIAPGNVVAVLARTAGLWSLHACRIIYIIDESGPVTRFGFGYGTLPGHAEIGEERFLIEWDQSSDAVSYDVCAFFRPRHPLVRVGWPVGKLLVDRFRRDSAKAMQKAVSPHTVESDECFDRP